VVPFWEGFSSLVLFSFHNIIRFSFFVCLYLNGLYIYIYYIRHYCRRPQTFWCTVLPSKRRGSPTLLPLCSPPSTRTRPLLSAINAHCMPAPQIPHPLLGINAQADATDPPIRHKRRSIDPRSPCLLRHQPIPQPLLRHLLQPAPRRHRAPGFHSGGTWRMNEHRERVG
jgi:hypothetical protein